MFGCSIYMHLHAFFFWWTEKKGEGSCSSCPCRNHSHEQFRLEMGFADERICMRLTIYYDFFWKKKKKRKEKKRI